MDLEEIVIMGIVVAIISAVAVIVSAILGDIASSGKLKEFLAGQHSLRSAEHDKIRTEQAEIKNKLSFLESEKYKELGRIESMRASNLDLEKIINQIMAMSVRLSDQEKEIAALKEKNASLEEENNRLQTLIQQYPAASDEDEDEWEM